MSRYRNVVTPSDFGPIIINKHDDTIGMCITEYGYWGTQDIRLIESLLKGTCQGAPAVTLLDIGSNIGTHALAFAQFDFPNLTVHAFEAQRQIYYMLAGTIALNSLSNVYCHHRAVSNVSGEKIRIPAVNYDSHSNFGSFEIEKARYSDTADMYIPGQYELLETVRIDDMGLENVKLLKVDVEGMEDRVIEGARQTIAGQRPLVFIETFKTDFGPIRDFLASLDYALYMTPAKDAIAIPREFGMGIAGAEQLL